MVRLEDYEAYWESVKLRLHGIKSIEFINSDKEIGTYIQNLSKEQHPILFIAIPSADGGKDVDFDTEQNIGLLFLLSKYDSQAKSIPFGIQKTLQPLFEKVKDTMKTDSMDKCSVMGKLVLDTMHSDPEFKLYNDLSGWSLSFIF